MFDTRNVLEKLQNCNGFFTTHRYPPWLTFRQRQRVFVQFPTATWSIYKHWHPFPHPPWQEPIYQVSRHYTEQFRIQERLNRIWSHITLWFDVKGNILNKSKVRYFTLNLCFCLFGYLIVHLIFWLIDWLIDWLGKMFKKLKLQVFWWWEIAWFSLVLLYLRISTRIPKSSRVKECSLAVFSAVSRKLSSDIFQILSMSELSRILSSVV